MRYAKTEQGQQVIKARSEPLSPRQRTLLLLCDGARPIGEIQATVGTSQADVDELLARGLIRPLEPGAANGAAPTKAAAQPRPAGGSPAPANAGSAPASPASASPASGSPAAEQSEADRYREAYPLATQFTSELGLKGFRLQLALESAMTLQDLSALLPRLSEALKSAHGAAKAAEKLAQLRRALGTG